MDDLFALDSGREKFMQRINLIDPVVVVHDDMKVAVNGIKDCILWSKSSSEPVGAVLTGVGGAGKSTLTQSFVAAFPRFDRDYGDRKVTIVPAFYAKIPPSATPKSTASALDKAVGDPKYKRGSEKDITERFVTNLETCETEIIFLDEFNHLKLRGATFGKNVCKWIKTLIDTTSIVICLAGTPDCLDLLESDEQLARRFARRFSLGILVAGDEKVGRSLDSYLVEYIDECKKKIGILEMPDFSSYVNVWRMSLATRGIPGFITLLIKEACLNAFSSGRDSIMMEDLAAAFDRGITSSVALTAPGVNPFRLSDARVKDAYMEQARDERSPIGSSKSICR
jgi:hypothetical protein